MSVIPSWIEGDPKPLGAESFRAFVRSLVRSTLNRPYQQRRKSREACPDAVRRLLQGGASLSGFGELFRDATVHRGDRVVIVARPFLSDVAGIDSPVGELLATLERAGSRLYFRIARLPEYPGSGLLVLSPRYRRNER
jgi:hypothetical protein